MPHAEGPYDAANAGDVLARFVGGEWVSWSPDELPDMGLGISLEGVGGMDAVHATFMAAPDGSMWASLCSAVAAVLTLRRAGCGPANSGGHRPIRPGV